MRLRLPLADFPAEPSELWELNPFKDCRGISCQQEGQRIPPAPSLAPLHAEVGMLSYQTKPDLLGLRKAQSQSCFHSRHIFHPLVVLHGEMEEKDELMPLPFLKKAADAPQKSSTSGGMSHPAFPTHFLNYQWREREMLNQRC